MEQKVIIELWGHGGTGKTSTLNLLIDLLESGELKYSGKDRRKCIEYQGRGICVTTAGDTEIETLRNVMYMAIHQWDIAVTAARTWGKTRKLIEKYSKGIGAKLIQINKCGNAIGKGEDKVEKFKEYNRRCADNIKEKIDGIIDSGIYPNDYSLAELFDKTERA